MDALGNVRNSEDILLDLLHDQINGAGTDLAGSLKNARNTAFFVDQGQIGKGNIFRPTIPSLAIHSSTT